MSPLLSSVIHTVAMDDPSGNWVFSPASYLASAHRVALLADGHNAISLAAALGTSVERLQSHIALTEASFAELDTFNCLLASAGWRDALVQEVLDTLASFKVNLKLFDSPADAVAQVNQLVAEKTRGLIRDLLTPDMVNEMTRMIVLNCVHFKREWWVEFDKPAHNEAFHNADGTTTQIGLLKRQHHYRYYEGSGYDIVEIRYRDTDICCYLFVPTNGGSVFPILDSFSNHYANITRVERQLECHLTVPPFKVETTLKLADATRYASLGCLFEETQDWKVFDWEKLNGGWAKVDAIAQKAYLDFAQKGTEAAAATAWMMMACSGCMMIDRTPPPVKHIRADRPFLFCLANAKAPAVPLFVGVVNQL